MMTELIKCSNCRCKFINDDEHIKSDFGYNRLGERFKCCLKCREKKREQTKSYAETHKEHIQEYNKLYRAERRDCYLQKNKEYRQRQAKQHSWRRRATLYKML